MPVPRDGSAPTTAVEPATVRFIGEEPLVAAWATEAGRATRFAAAERAEPERRFSKDAVGARSAAAATPRAALSASRRPVSRR